MMSGVVPDMMHDAAGSFRVPMDHPSLPGHFSSGPIVPGVVLLDEAFTLILAANPGQVVVGLPSVKFVRPVLPAQPVTVWWRAAAGHRIAFTCAVAAQTVLHGSVRLGVKLPDPPVPDRRVPDAHATAPQTPAPKAQDPEVSEPRAPGPRPVGPAG
jgi:3-hydroxyacyl-[acyl-carrier-protein] dehydratase